MSVTIKQVISSVVNFIPDILFTRSKSSSYLECAFYTPRPNDKIAFNLQFIFVLSQLFIKM